MPNLKEYLKKKLTQKELALFRKSFDIIGSIALLEIPRELTKKQKIIASAVLNLHNNVLAVYKEAGARKGKLRLQKLKWLAGVKSTETICRENEVDIKLDIAKVYFSPRLSTERKRIYQQIKKPETVLVMFSGCGPYVIEIAKHTKAKVVGIEVNKAGHQYAIENAKLNKVENKVKFYCGDVKKILPKLKSFDRILMPLPKGAGKYLELALKHIKPGGIIHLYDFLREEEILSGAAKILATKRKVKILRTVKCGQLAPRAYRVCIDFRVD